MPYFIFKNNSSYEELFSAIIAGSVLFIGMGIGRFAYTAYTPICLLMEY